MPKVARISIYAWPEPLGRPTRVGVDIVRLDEDVLPHPISVEFQLTNAELPMRGVDDTATTTISAAEVDYDDADPRPQTIRMDGAEWHLCARGGRAREVTSLDDVGQPIFQEVDLAVRCYKLICPKCGRARYSKRNSIHQIKYCRVCTRQVQLRRRALAQYRQRERQGTHRNTPPHKIDEALVLYAELKNVDDVAQRLNMTSSGMTKLLRRYGAFDAER